MASVIFSLFFLCYLRLPVKYMHNTIPRMGTIYARRRKCHFRCFRCLKALLNYTTLTEQQKNLQNDGDRAKMKTNDKNANNNSLPNEFQSRQHRRQRQMGTEITQFDTFEWDACEVHVCPRETMLFWLSLLLLVFGFYRIFEHWTPTNMFEWQKRSAFLCRSWFKRRAIGNLRWNWYIFRCIHIDAFVWNNIFQINAQRQITPKKNDKNSCVKYKYMDHKFHLGSLWTWCMDVRFEWGIGITFELKCFIFRILFNGRSITVTIC